MITAAVAKRDSIIRLLVDLGSGVVVDCAVGKTLGEGDELGREGEGEDWGWLYVGVCVGEGVISICEGEEEDTNVG